jgi:hypothetical protein
MPGMNAGSMCLPQVIEQLRSCADGTFTQIPLPRCLPLHAADPTAPAPRLLPPCSAWLRAWTGWGLLPWSIQPGTARPW